MLAALAALHLTSAAIADETKGKWLPLLVIERSNSKNRVHYDLVVDEQCRPLGEEPVKIYWRMLEEGPDVTEGLTLLERVRGYGLKFQQLVDGWVHFRFKAYPARLARAHSYEKDGRCHADLWAEIDGKQAIMERVWVKVEHPHWWRLPSVPYVDAFAHAKDGTPIQERIVP
jgi:hypothetical protein